MHDLTDTTFVIPARIDSAERLMNLRHVVSYLRYHFDTSILVVESDTESKIGRSETWDHIFIQDPVFHRAKLLNLGFKASLTPNVVNYDTDVLFEPWAYLEARSYLDDPKVAYAYPYDGSFYDVGDRGRTEVQSTRAVSQFADRPEYKAWLEKGRPVPEPENSEGYAIHRASWGGAIFSNKARLADIGYENEHFMNWGWEDDERWRRALKLGYRIKRVQKSTLWHLPHPRGNTQWYRGPKSMAELNRISIMSPDQLRAEVDSWPWRQNGNV